MPAEEAVAPEATGEHWVFAPTSKRASVTRVDEDMVEVKFLKRMFLKFLKLVVSRWMNASLRTSD